MLAVTATASSVEEPLRGLTIGDRPEPVPRNGWTLVRVRAASLNHHDIWTLRGVGISAERLPVILGCDAAGVTDDGREVVVHAVVATPEGGDETLAPGASILSEQHDGTFAEVVAVPTRNLVDKPAELSFTEAACLPTAYLTVYRALFTRGGLGPGDRLLIQGAGGGVATAAIQMARASGAVVIVTSRSEHKRRRARELGAHQVLPTGERLSERVDVVLDSVGQATWEHSLKSTRGGGVVVCVGATTGPDPPATLQHVFFRQLSVVGSTMGTRQELEGLVRFLRATGLRPLIDGTFPLAESRRAFERMLAGEVFGKLVLTVP